MNSLYPATEEQLEYLNLLEEGRIPEMLPRAYTFGDTFRGLGKFELRHRQIEIAGFSVIIESNIALLRKMLQRRYACVLDPPPQSPLLQTTILEVFAGNAWWSKVFEEEFHCNAIAVDNFSGRWYQRDKQRKVHPVIECDGIGAAEQMRNDDACKLLVMAWPSDAVDDTDTSFEVARAWGEEKPILYIGEDCGGCCAGEKFFKHFKIEDSEYPKNYQGIHEHYMFGHYRKVL